MAELEHIQLLWRLRHRLARGKEVKIEMRLVCRWYQTMASGEP